MASTVAAATGNCCVLAHRTCDALEPLAAFSANPGNCGALPIDVNPRSARWLRLRIRNFRVLTRRSGTKIVSFFHVANGEETIMNVKARMLLVSMALLMALAANG